MALREAGGGNWNGREMMGLTFSLTGEVFTGDSSALMTRFGEGDISDPGSGLTGLSTMGDSLVSVVLVTWSGLTSSSWNTSSLSSSVSTPDKPPLPVESVLDLCDSVPTDPPPPRSSLFRLLLIRCPFSLNPLANGL